MTKRQGLQTGKRPATVTPTGPATFGAPAILIDPEGDLLLIVGNIKQPILVSSHVLHSAGKGFREIIGEDFEKTKELAQGENAYLRFKRLCSTLC